MNHFTLLLLIIISTIACKKDKVIELKNSQGIVYQRITLFGDTTLGKNGIYEKFDSLGQPIEYATYINNKLEGEKKLFEDGKIYSSEFHKNDLYEGPYKVFYPNGSVQLESQYINNEMQGELKSYYLSGKLKEVVQMKANQEDGPFIEYYESGNKKAEGTYKEGAKENGLLMLYDSLGVLARKMDCVDGICHTIWTRNSTENTSTK